MFGIDDSIIAAGVSGLFSYMGQEDTNQQNQQNVQAQMDFQREMSNTAYQRAVKDMGKAGLNPMLAYSQGGASTPIGGAAKFDNPAAAASQSASQAATTSMAAAQVDATRASAEAARAAAEKNKAEAAEINSTLFDESGQPKGGSLKAANVNAQTELYGSTSRQNAKRIEQIGKEMELTDEEIRRVKAQIPGTIAASKITAAEVQRALNESRAAGTWYGRNIQPYLPDFLKSINSAGSASRALGR